jgi:hypothetical protein
MSPFCIGIIRQEALSVSNRFNSVSASGSRLLLIQAKALGGLAVLWEAKREVGHFLQGRR